MAFFIWRHGLPCLGHGIFNARHGISQVGHRNICHPYCLLFQCILSAVMILASWISSDRRIKNMISCCIGRPEILQQHLPNMMNQSNIVDASVFPIPSPVLLEKVRLHQVVSEKLSDASSRSMTEGGDLNHLQWWLQFSNQTKCSWVFWKGQRGLCCMSDWQIYFYWKYSAMTCGNCMFNKRTRVFSEFRILMELLIINWDWADKSLNNENLPQSLCSC
jgi:hypothetical protein